MTIATIASQFINNFGNRALRDDQGMIALKWLSETDPHGNAALDKPSQTVTYKFTDGSKILLDLQTAIFSEVQS